MILMAAAVSLLAGATNVLNRSFNARLAKAAGSFAATLANYITGLCVSALVLAALWRRLPPLPRQLPNGFLFAGGAVGVAVVALLSAVTPKISAVYLTLLTFAGQVLAGVIFDALSTGAVAWQNLAGALLVSAGMAVNLLAERGGAKGGKPPEKTSEEAK